MLKRQSIRTLSWLLAGAGLVAAPATANAAPPVLPPTPNVLVVIDSSGSMARTSAGNLPNCSPGYDSTTLPLPAGDIVNMDRWGQVVQGLTGTVKPFYSCGSVSRSTTTDGNPAPTATTGGIAIQSPNFINEYRIGTNNPPDYGYPLPYNRPLSGDMSLGSTNICGVSPNKLPGTNAGSPNGVGPALQGDTTHNPDWWDPDYIHDRQWPEITGITSSVYGPVAGAECVFQQALDGQLDTGNGGSYGFVRFALMTSDKDPSMTTPAASNGYGVQPIVPDPYTATQIVTGAPFGGEYTYFPFRFFNNGAGGTSGLGGTTYINGKLPGCATNTPFAVGSRGWGAPPWEGRLVRFPKTGEADSVNNDEIQRSILASRPYGASPIEGMLYDAYDYLWFNNYGPSGAAGYGDPKVTASPSCRDQYVILITDGASNLDMRSTAPTSCSNGGSCPFPTALQTVQALYGTDFGVHGNPGLIGGIGSPGSVNTFVIGFSAKGDSGTPDPAWFGAYGSCNAWFVSPAGGNKKASTMNTVCAAPPGPMPAGSTPAACCYLNNLAYAGSGAGTDPIFGVDGVGAFFVDNQAEFSAAFATILSKITATQTSRTPPSYSQTYYNSATTSNGNASFFSSFSPTTGGLWATNVNRRRNVCQSNGTISLNNSDPVGNSSHGDNFTVNMNGWPPGGPNADPRYFLSVHTKASGGKYDSRESTRPYDTASADGVTDQPGTEALLNGTTQASAGGFNPDEFTIDKNTCVAINTTILEPAPAVPVTVSLPALNGGSGANNCMDATWAFATGYQSTLNLGTPNDYNFRCSPSRVPNLYCNVLGGDYHSEPTVVAPPNAYIPDEAYQAFAAQYKNRPNVMYFETLDGLLHAFDATVDFGGSGPHKNELFSFIPPYTLNDLYSNYPNGDKQLLDSTPVIKDAVWERNRTDIGSAAATRWHSNLVAGMQNGYFALEVTDPVAGVVNSQVGLAAQGGPWAAPTVGNPQAVFENGTRVKGPHFLWQLSFVDQKGPSGGKGHHYGWVNKKNGKGVSQIFGELPGKPAITTLYFDPSGGSSPREIGVAILPGGVNISGAIAGGECPRATGVALAAPNGVGNYAANPPYFSYPALGGGYLPRTKVRQWETPCDAGVPGRILVIARLDSGEIIRVFGRANQDIPDQINSTVVTDTPLDSPMTGTPIVYPFEVGAVASKFFIGDADGTVWRFDVSSTDPTKWSGHIFYDTQNLTVTANPAKEPGLDGQPIIVDPVLSTDSLGRTVLSVSTGDQDNLTTMAPNCVAPGNCNPNPPKNTVVSLRETAVSVAPYLNTEVLWYLMFANNGERVTGPMAVFGGVLYFATYAPAAGAVCSNGTSYIWGLDYVNAQGGTPSAGGSYRYPAANPVAPGNVAQGNVLVPGITIQAQLNCASVGSTSDFYGSRSSLSFPNTGVTSGQPGFALQASSSTGGVIGGIGSGLQAISPPQPATVDSWGAVIE
jgi:type IV pilus assembly protein PilY1